ncbi:MAG: hypothetical protein CVT90_01530 [Candidatus Altiarchaeales archaeon HGW-Altiarchaeales-3]|nr:MAG: hypothetical protein CVT90_01530 [Candidatus Altiarchaeales archaeon HGW-Altiarchaeales-3]
MIIFDTDILSCFGKIRKVHLLKKVFSGKFIISHSVYNELQKAKNMGFEWVDDIFAAVDMISLTEKEIVDYKEIISKETSIHPGEIESIILCKHRDCLFVTDDKRAKNYCDKKAINYFDLHDILRHLFRSGTLSRDETIHIINEIEEKDHRVIKGWENILNESKI